MLAMGNHLHDHHGTYLIFFLVAFTKFIYFTFFVQWAPSALVSVEDSSWRTFLRRLIDFYKPSQKRFARVEVAQEKSHIVSRVGCLLVQFLAEQVEVNFSKKEEIFSKKKTVL